MSSSVYRFGITLIPSSFITFILLAFMMALIYTGKQEPITTPEISLLPIFNVDNPTPPEPRILKPVEPPVASPPPKAARTPPTTGGPTAGPGFETPQNTFTPPVLDPLAINNSPYIPIYVPQPRFPIKAMTQGVNGYAIIEVTIATSGSVRDPSIVEEYPEGYGFGKEALKAARKLKYQPKTVEGKTVEVPGVLYKYSFNIEK